MFNPTGWERHDPVEAIIPKDRTGWRLLADGREIPYQQAGEEEEGTRIAFLPPAIPAYGYRFVRLAAPGSAETGRGADAYTEEEVVLREIRPDRYEFENRFFRAVFNRAGQLVSWWDKQAGREVLPPGAVGNQLQLFEDRPLNFDAWDINLYYQDKVRVLDEPAEIRIPLAGPVRAVLETRRSVGRSLVVQRITAHAGLPRLDFETEVDWHEEHVLLKAAFPVDVHAGTATYDIQFGNVTRPTHANTSWDWARFEVCAHKWADLSEGDYGVSLLNDCKYGYDIRDNVIRLTLLRSPRDPDPHADEGRHIFTYSLFPHQGDWRCGTIRQAYGLNMPLLARYGSPASNNCLPHAIDGELSDNAPVPYR